MRRPQAIFINDGEQIYSHTIYATDDEEAKRITDAIEAIYNEEWEELLDDVS